MTDWEAIKQAYIAGSVTYRELARRHGVSYADLARRGKEENWVAQRMGCRTDPEQIRAICSRLLQKLEAMVEALPATAAACGSLRHISGTLKDIRDLQMNKEDTATTVAVSLSSEVEEYAG